MGFDHTMIWEHNGSAGLTALAEQYGTPFYLYDADAIKSRIRSVRDSLEGLVEVYLAVKANPNLALLRAVRETADGLDISSGGELQQALLAGYNAKHMSFAGPAKRVEELTASIEHGVGCISVESLRELNDCIAIAKRLGKTASILLRINPKLLNRTFGMKMGGRPIQFGVDEEIIPVILRRIKAHLDCVNFQGIHIYAGSQCFDAEGVVEGVSNTLRIAREIESTSSLRCTIINLGGGFGVSHTNKDTQLDLAALASQLVPVLRAFHDESEFPRELVLELGRFLTACAGLYVTRVISTKESRGKSFFVVDGGLHHHLSAAGTFGTALRANFVLRNISRPDAVRVKCNIAGSSCNPTDLLGVGVELPRPEPGDLLGVESAGSYGLTASPILFLGRPTPAELVHSGGKIVLGRASKVMTDFN